MMNKRTPASYFIRALCTTHVLAKAACNAFVAALIALGTTYSYADTLSRVKQNGEINLGYAEHKTHLIEFGRLVYASKLALQRGQWEEMFRHRIELDLPFGKTKGKNWASIGEVCGANGQSSDHLAQLPGPFDARMPALHATSRPILIAQTA